MGMEEKDGENGHGNPVVQSSHKAVGRWDCHPQGRRNGEEQVGLSAYFNFFTVIRTKVKLQPHLGKSNFPGQTVQTLPSVRATTWKIRER